MFPSTSLYRVCQFVPKGVDGVDECDEVRDLFDFVSLEVADHMPAYAVGDSDVS